MNFIESFCKYAGAEGFLSALGTRVKKTPSYTKAEDKALGEWLSSLYTILRPGTPKRLLERAHTQNMRAISRIPDSYDYGSIVRLENLIKQKAGKHPWGRRKRSKGILLGSVK